jgi:hypothetical protein
MGMTAVTLRKTNTLTYTFTKIIKLSSSLSTAARRNNINNIRGMKRKYTLNTLRTNHSANSKHLIHALALSAKYRAAENLDSALTSLADPAMNINCITYLKIRHLFSLTLLFN